MMASEIMQQPKERQHNANLHAAKSVHNQTEKPSSKHSIDLTELNPNEIFIGLLKKLSM